MALESRVRKTWIIPHFNHNMYFITMITIYYYVIVKNTLKSQKNSKMSILSKKCVYGQKETLKCLIPSPEKR